MKKQDIIDALRALNVQDDEMQGMTIPQLGELLKQRQDLKRLNETPEKPENVEVVEITRSYSRKVNLGNYQSADYFCSRKAEVRGGDDVKAVSNWLSYECKIDVEDNIRNDFQKKDKLNF